MIKNNHGGKRENSGRKFIKDKKQQVYFSLRESEIKRLGGVNRLRKLVKELVNRLVKESFQEVG